METENKEIIQIYKKLGHIFSNNEINKNLNNEKISDENFYIRKLTPIECERLQTIDDNYTKY